MTPPHRPAIIYLPDLIAGLMTSPAEPDGDDGLIIEPEFGDALDTATFSDEQYTAVASLLKQTDTDGIRLSDLFERSTPARRIGRTAQPRPSAGLARTGSVRRTAPRPERGTVLAALADDRELDDDRFAGHDLLVVHNPAASVQPAANDLEEGAA
ncbi:hypothetical protein [Streptomyces noursei]|uniref:hypothetical protein n=1 Tax=Streptomyces noursei TaxID=1971 RepID=UPI0021A2DBCD|nr:hypothetical protein [Streptomyces noursei]UWS69824.1 hypothetical protein N1H47_00100 [Streptomyces noursei]UWS76955.1 hypothetical protein N1H47_40420 [Streptomyces noursei]